MRCQTPELQYRPKKKEVTVATTFDTYGDVAMAGETERDRLAKADIAIIMISAFTDCAQCSSCNIITILLALSL